MTVSAMTPHDATAAVPPQIRRSFPSLDQLPPAVLRRPPSPTRRVTAAPADRPDLPVSRSHPATGHGPIAVCGSCLLVAAGPKGDVLAVDPSRPRAPRRVVGRHGAPVTALVASAGLVVSAGCDGLVLGRSVAGTDDLVAVVGNHLAGVTDARLGPDGRLVTAGHDGRALAWRDGAPELVATHHGGIEAVVVLPTGGVVTAGRDGRLLHRDPRGGVVELRRRRRELILAMTPAAPAGLLTAGGQRGAVRLWDDRGDGGWPEELGVHGTWVLALVTLDDDRVAAVGGDHVTVWDLRSGNDARIPLGRGLHATSAVPLGIGGLAVADADGAVEVLPASRLA